MHRKKIAVIGSGIAGLTAAYDLQKDGHDVTVYESDSFAGGRMADRIVNGICTHSGASIIFSFNKDMLALIDELGIRGDLHDLGDATSVQVDNGEKRYELRLTFSPAYLLGHPAFGLATKAKLATLLPDIIRAGARTDPCLMHTAVEYDDESVASYVTRKVSAEFLENYVEPYFRAPWHWEPEMISRAYLLSLMGHIVTGTEYTFKQGIGHLTRTLASKLNVQLNKKVTHTANGDSNVTLEIEHAGKRETIAADLVVCAVQGTRVAGMVSDLSTLERRFFENVRYTRGARVYYAIKNRSARPERTWFTRNHPSKVSLYHVSVADPFTPEGFTQPAHLQAELTPDVSRQVAADCNQANLESYIRSDVVKLYPALDQDLISIAPQWWDEMLPEWYPGYTKLVAAFLDAQEAGVASGKSRTIYFCGDYLSQSHTGGACASGRRVAKLISRDLAVRAT